MWLLIGGVAAPVAYAEGPEAADPGPNAAASQRASEPTTEGQPGSVELAACAYQGITPGQTSVDEARNKFGEPAEDTTLEGQRVLIYHQQPFAKVELHVTEEKVSSVVLFFTKPALPTQIEHELKLKDVVPVPVINDKGQMLGRYYPERGVLISFDPEQKARRAIQVVLEALTAEPFLLRVQADTGHHYARSLTDLETARKLEPTDVAALEESARLLALTGEPKQALELIEQARQLQPGDLGLLLREVELLVRLDRLDEARDKAKTIVDDQAEEPLIRARGQKVLGDLAMLGDSPDPQRAIEYHMAAIKQVAPAASDKRRAVRLAAKELLIESFLAAAREIAAGKWLDKNATTEKWLASARELAETLVAQDGGDEVWQLRVTLGTLAAHAELDSSAAPDLLVAAVMRESQRWCETGTDPLFKREIELLRVRALFDAATISHRRERSAQARELAIQSAKAFEAWSLPRELDPSERYLVGRQYFFLGSLAAVAERNHAEAVEQYGKARRFLQGDPPNCFARDLGRHGERFVSMGASYFEIGEQDLGVTLTREGLEAMKEAADKGLIEAKRLALPYNNLAAMFNLQGKPDEAKELAEVAARLDANPSPQRR